MQPQPLSKLDRPLRTAQVAQEREQARSGRLSKYVIRREWRRKIHEQRIYTPRLVKASARTDFSTANVKKDRLKRRT
jgi:hypothetical protein